MTATAPEPELRQQTLQLAARPRVRNGSDSIILSSSRCFPLRPEADMPMGAPAPLGLRVN